MGSSSVDLALVDADLAGREDGVGDVLVGHRTEEAVGRSHRGRDGQHGLGEHVPGLLGPLGLAAGVSRLLFHDLPHRGDAARGGHLGQLAREQEVARVSFGHVRHFALLAQLVHILQ